MPDLRNHFVGLLFVWVVLIASPAFAGERTVGRWVDTVGTSYTAEIWIVASGPRYFMVSKFMDGSSRREELVEREAGPRQRHVFAAQDNGHGEWYAIDLGGNLEMYDEDGFIREAKIAR